MATFRHGLVTVTCDDRVTCAQARSDEARTALPLVEVCVSCDDGVLVVALRGEVDPTAPAIVEAAVAAARDDHIRLVVDTQAAHPKSSPILGEVAHQLRSAESE